MVVNLENIWFYLYESFNCDLAITLLTKSLGYVLDYPIKYWIFIRYHQDKNPKNFKIIQEILKMICASASGKKYN